MEIYVVQPGDNINAIAERYGVPASKLILDNELQNPNNLIPGQTIVVVYPSQTYTIQDGDTLTGIAEQYGVPVLELLSNNPFLADRDVIYPGETLTIRYDTNKKLAVNGYVYPFISRKILIETLPSLTYISIYNYRATAEGNINAFYDDTEIIQLSKNYGVIPLMLISTLSAQGNISAETAYQILLNDASQERYIENMVTIIQAKGYYGANITFSFINATTQKFYESFLTKITNRLRQAGLLIFVTISPAARTNVERVFERIDYSALAEMADSLSFIHYIWGTNYGPPSPIYHNDRLRDFLDFLMKTVAPEKVHIGAPVLGYDWELPYIEGRSNARSITLDAALDLARESGTRIEFDDKSMTPYIQYEQFNFGTPIRHIVWFIDAKSINALISLATEYGLAGIGVWTIMVYYPQLWLEVNSQFETEKLIS